MLTGPINRWWSVLAGSLGCAVGSGIVVLYTFPLFATAFQTEFHWDRVIYSYCLSSFLLATGFGTVTLGIAIRRFGVRVAAAAYVAIFAAAIAAIAALPPIPSMFYGAFALVGFGGAAATAMPYAVSVAGWFDEKRGLALGLVNAGAGFGSTLAPFVAHDLLVRFGWRGGFLGVAALAGTIAVFGLTVLVREPVQTTELPAADGSAITPSEFGFLRKARFWLIALPIVGVSIATFGVMGSIVPFLNDRHFEVTSIALALSTAGIASWLGRLITGYLLDRVFAPYLAAGTFFLAVTGILVLAGSSDSHLLVVGMALIGLTLGAEGDLVVFLVSRYYDFSIYSRVLGAIWISWAWGGGIGTFIAGTSFRLFQSYSIGLGIFVALLVLSAGLILRLGPYLHPVHRSRVKTTT